MALKLAVQQDSGGTDEQAWRAVGCQADDEKQDDGEDREGDEDDLADLEEGWDYLARYSAYIGPMHEMLREARWAVVGRTEDGEKTAYVFCDT